MAESLEKARMQNETNSTVEHVGNLRKLSNCQSPICHQTIDLVEEELTVAAQRIKLLQSKLAEMNIREPANTSAACKKQPDIEEIETVL